MEIVNSGIIGVTETRTNINAMKDFYRAEYKKIIDKEKKSDSDLFHNRWKVRFGSFATRVGLLFQPRSAYNALARIGTRLISGIVQRAMVWKNKHDKKKFNKQKDQLTADFINGEGKFEQFMVANPTTIEEISDYEEEEQKGFSR